MTLRTARSKEPVSIQTKLTVLVITSLAVAVLTASLVSMWHEAHRFLRTKQETLSATAFVFGAAASAATASRDADGIRQVLRGITSIPQIHYAEVLTAKGTPIAALGAAVRRGDDLEIGDTSPNPAIWSLLIADTIAVTTPIIDGGRKVGNLTLVAQSDLRSQIWVVLGVALAGSMAALVPSLLLTRRLQRSITRPLHQLARAMDDVARTGNYASVTTDSPDQETARLELSFNVMIAKIKLATEKILSRESEIIQRLSLAGELRDDQTGQHVARVARISRILAEKLELDPCFVDDLCRASPMHDVGKISIPDAILHKPGRLDAEERAEMEKHAYRGYEILSGSDSELVQLAAEIALSHHERWDGAGYPNKIAGENIPISGRLTAVADVCDALFSERPYKTPWPADQIRQHFIDNAGTHFDPRCIDALLDTWPSIKAIYTPA